MDKRIISKGASRGLREPKSEWYPTWTCHECAVDNGGAMVKSHLATWHSGVCDVCRENKPVTEPRDYRYPKFKKPTSC